MRKLVQCQTGDKGRERLDWWSRGYQSGHPLEHSKGGVSDLELRGRALIAPLEPKSPPSAKTWFSEQTFVYSNQAA